MHENNLEDYMSKIAKLIPNAHKIKKGKHITRKSTNKAYASDFTGTNPFGGVCINKDLVENYQETKREVINLLSTVHTNGEPIFEWIIEREQMFSGEFLERLPDILFCLKPQYGVNWNLHTKEITVNPTHKKISGGHKEYGVFISNIHKANFADDDKIKMTNFYSTMLALFGIDTKDHQNGRSFICMSK
jgi:hypothetical protein